MGNNHTKPISSFSDWEKVQNNGDIEIYKNKKSNQLAEKRSITLDPHYELQDQLKIYHMRQNNNDSLVKAFGAEEIVKKGHSQGICSGHKKLDVLTQQILYRLSDLPQLTFPQTLLFLRESLRAYSRVFKSYGPIHITKKLIGINEFGQVRSWVNQNWAINHPNSDLPTLQSTKLDGFGSRSTEGSSEGYDARYRDETEMVHNIVAVIEQKCEEGKFPQAFSEQVEQHSGSFRKLSTYVEDFIRVNELFIPPKINYQTVFVSKYQTRLVQQHQQSGQQLSTNQGQFADQSVTHKQKVITNTTEGNQGYSLAGGYTSAGGYNQQTSSAQHSYGYGTNLIQAQPPTNQKSYTVTKTTTTTYNGNTIGSGNNNNIYTNTYNPSSTTFKPLTYQQYQQPTAYHAESSILSNNKNLTNLPWQKTQSIYKPPEAQSTYTSYQYSATNPSSVAGNNYSSTYNFGLNSLNSGKEIKSNEQFKPSSYSSTFSNGVTGLGYGNTITSLENKYGTVESSSNNTGRFAIGEGDAVSSPYQNLAIYTTNTNERKAQYMSNISPQINNSISNSANKVSYQQFKRNFNNPSTSAGLNTYEYSSSVSQQKGNPYEPLVSDISKGVGSTFSFDGLNNHGAKFSQYSSNGYNNALASYNTNNEAHPDGSQFNPMLGPLLKMKEQYEAHLKQSQNQQAISKAQVNEASQHA